MVVYGERGYLAIMEHTLRNGVDTPDRTGVGCRKTFNHQIIYRMDKGEFPFSTVRPAPLWMAFEEFWMFMRGETNTKVLEKKGINFWKGNTSREFLDNRGLQHLPEGSMGEAYGAQWRRFGGAHDQLQETVDNLKNDPYSRRMYTTFWNPSASQNMALTPCWHSHLFNVMPDEDGSLILNLKVFNRSLDVTFGAQFAMQQYALYMMCMAKLSGMKLGELVFDLSDVHIYHNQMEFVEEILTRDFGKSGIVEITKPLQTIDDMISLQWDDISVTGLEVNTAPFTVKRPPMAV